MAMTVYLDPISTPGRGDFDTQSGWSPERSAIVTGVTYTGTDYLYRALDDLVTLGTLPQVGAAHPTIAGCNVSGYSVEGIEPGKILVRIRYRQAVAAFNEEQYQQQQAASSSISFSASLAQVQTNKDVNGALITVEHGSERQSGLVTRLVPQLVMTISRMEIGSPVERIKPILGKLNQSGWRVRPNDPAGTWLLASVNATSADLGLSYRVDYQFEYREPEGPYSAWDEQVCFIDPTTGRPPDDVYESPGLVRVQMFLQADFNALLLA